MDALHAALDRLVNELPSIAVGFGAVLYVFGWDVSEAALADVVERAEAVVGVVLWLFVRGGIDGPVTRVRNEPEPRVEGDLPGFVHYEADR